MNKKRWINLILLIMVLLAISIKLVGTAFSLLNLSNDPSYFFNQDHEFFNLSSKFSQFTLYQSFNRLFGKLYISEFIFNLILSFSNFILGFVFIKIYKMFFEQGSVVVRKNKIGVIKNGIVVYGVFVGIILLFLFSIVGYGISFLFMLLAIFFMYVGKTSLYITIGQKIKHSNNIYIDMLIGYFIIEAVRCIPYIRWSINGIVMPIVSLGIVGQTSINLYCTKKFYESPYWSYSKKDFNKDKIYDIISSNDK